MYGCWLFLRGFVSLIYLGKLKDDEFSWSPPSIAKSKVHTVILHVVFSIFSARTIHYGVQQSIKVTYCHFWAINILVSDSLAWFISSSGYYLLFIFIPCAVLYVNGCLSLCGRQTDGLSRVYPGSHSMAAEIGTSTPAMLNWNYLECGIMSSISDPKSLIDDFRIHATAVCIVS